jgi:hypothetical protein
LVNGLFWWLIGLICSKKINKFKNRLLNVGYSILVGKSEGKRPLGRPWRRWLGITVDRREVGGRGWIGLVWLRIGTSGGLL